MNIPIGSKISFGFGIIIILMMVLGFVSIESIKKINDAYQINANTLSPTKNAFVKIQNTFLLKASAKSYYQDGNFEEGEEIWRKSDIVFQENIARLKKIINNEKSVAYLIPIRRIEQIEEIDQRLKILKESLVQEYRQSKHSNADLTTMSADEINFNLTVTEQLIMLDALSLTISTIDERISNQVEATITASKNKMTFIIMVIILIGIGAAYYLSRTISLPILKLTEVSKKISGGDLDATVNITSNDEIGIMADNFNQMTQKLRNSRVMLENQVKERTKELDNKVQQLESMNKHMVDRELKMIDLKKQLKEKIPV